MNTRASSRLLSRKELATSAYGAALADCAGSASGNGLLGSGGGGSTGVASARSAFARSIAASSKYYFGCLYNQETDEQPQLYFSHMFKVGNSLELAKEIRDALDRAQTCGRFWVAPAA